MENKELAVMYLRLSKDDGEMAESNSISSQREIIRHFAEANGIKICNEYIDDGYSGATFDRPSFNKMISDMEDEKFNIIIVKDLSRLGRDYIESGKFIQKIFPENNIRFISINDNYDSNYSDSNETHLILPIKNFINDSYCRDISTKIKTANKAKKEDGKFVAAFTTYGYIKDPKDKYKLVVDDGVRWVIEKIFDMKMMGYSSNYIAKCLNDLGVSTPAKRKKELGYNLNGFLSIDSKWSAKQINRIIENRIYTGRLEQGKTEKINYKSKKLRKIKSDNWIVKEDAHEAIIDNEIFELSNRMISKDIISVNGEISLLSGLIYCGDCGSVMKKKKIKYKTGNESIFYICSKYVYDKNCTRHSIKENELLEIIVEIVKNHLSVKEKLTQKSKKINFNDKIYCDNEIENLEKEKIRLEQIVNSLETDLKDGIVENDEFYIFKSKYISRIETIEKQIINRKKMILEISQNLNTNENNNDFDELNNNIVDRYTLIKLIDKILVYEGNEISIIFFDDEKINIMDEMIKSYEKSYISEYELMEVSNG